MSTFSDGASSVSTLSVTGAPPSGIHNMPKAPFTMTKRAKILLAVFVVAIIAIVATVSSSSSSSEEADADSSLNSLEGARGGQGDKDECELECEEYTLHVHCDNNLTVNYFEDGQLVFSERHPNYLDHLQWKEVHTVEIDVTSPENRIQVICEDLHVIGGVIATLEKCGEIINTNSDTGTIPKAGDWYVDVPLSEQDQPLHLPLKYTARGAGPWGSRINPTSVDENAMWVWDQAIKHTMYFHLDHSCGTVGPVDTCEEQSVCMEIEFDYSECPEDQCFGNGAECAKAKLVWNDENPACKKTGSISHACPGVGGPKDDPWLENTELVLDVAPCGTAIFGVKDQSQCSGPGVFNVGGYSGTCSGPENVCTGNNDDECQWEFEVPCCPTPNPTRSPTETPTDSPTGSPTESPSKSPIKLRLTSICQEESKHIFRVMNQHDVDVPYTWEVYGCSDSECSGSGTAKANSNDFFRIPRPDLANAGTTKIFWYDGDTRKDTVKAANKAECLKNLILTAMCTTTDEDDNQIATFRVRNQNNKDVDFTFEKYGCSAAECSGSGVATANTDVYFELPAGTAKIYWQSETGTESTTKAHNPKSCPTPAPTGSPSISPTESPTKPPIKLRLTSICQEESKHIFRVMNQHDVDVPYTWEVYGCSDSECSGSGTAKANSNDFFRIPRPDLANAGTTKIFWYDGDTRKDTVKAANKAECLKNLILTAMCTTTDEDDNQIATFRVRNQNNKDVDFTFEKYGCSAAECSGSGVATANTDVYFELPAGTAKIYWQSETGTESTTKSTQSKILPNACSYGFPINVTNTMAF